MFNSIEEAIAAGKYTRKVPEPRIKDRWSDGVDHEPGAIELVELMGLMDFENFDDHFCIKTGGDGDNGEALAYILDALIENGLVTITIHDPAAPQPASDKEVSE